MLIETEEWVKLSDAGKALGIQQSVAYRTAHRLGIARQVFGLFIVRKADVHKIADHKLTPGWHWKADPEKAAKDSKKGVVASLKARGLKRRPTSRRSSRGTSGTATAGPKAE